MYKFKRIFALMISAAVMTCFMTVSAKDAFNDVDVNNDCFNAVTMLSEMNVVQGDGYGNFNPEKFVSRAEFLSMVKGAFSLSGNTDTDFTDVSDTDWFAEAVGICVNLGIIRGVNSTEFCPDDYLTKWLHSAKPTHFTQRDRHLVLLQSVTLYQSCLMKSHLSIQRETAVTPELSRLDPDAVTRLKWLYLSLLTN